MDIVGAVTSVMGCLCGQNCFTESLSRQIGHIKRPKRKLGELRAQMELLMARAEDVKKKLEALSKQRGMEPTEVVKLWLKHVEKITTEVTAMLDEIQEHRCRFNGCSPNYLPSRLRLGEAIEQKINEITQLLHRGGFSDEQLASILAVRGSELPASPLQHGATTMTTAEEILQYLNDDHCTRIGIYGMGGVGKTTLMKDIHNRLVKESPARFDSVIWVSVPKDFSVENLQRRIAEQVDLDFRDSGEDPMKRSTRLFTALNRSKRFLLFLDDLWESFRLEEVGIPIPTTDNGHKIVLTTRSQTVCRSMETQGDVQLKVLSEEEAWHLFKNKVALETFPSPEIEAVARNVAKECGGLPLAIITIGCALRNENDASKWENALAELRSPNADIEQMEDAVFSCLRFSFTRLKDAVCQSCFLYCALYPEGDEILEAQLIDYWMWEGLLGNVESIEVSRRKGKRILSKLKDACLLEGVTKYGFFQCVKAHDLIRDMAVGITSRNPHRCLIRAWTAQRKLPRKEEWTEDIERVSLMENGIEGIPYRPMCPELRCLLLQHNPLSNNISHCFFEYMPNLTVLDLSHTRIQFLPQTLSDLENLHALILSSCSKLENVPSVAKLTKLGALDLSYCQKIAKLPQGMENLCNLRSLNLSGTSIEMFPTGILKEYTLLEEFSMLSPTFYWGSKSVNTVERAASVEELFHATSLLNLRLKFLNSEAFDVYMRSGHWKQLNDFKFQVGQVLEGNFWWSMSQTIHLKGDFFLSGHPVLLPPNTLELKLIDCNDIRSLSSCVPNLTRLRNCEIINCKDTECIAISGEKNNLCRVENLSLKNLSHLQKIWKGAGQGTLSSLKIIHVSDCSRLKSLFPHGSFCSLQNLEYIRVSDCGEMESIVEEEEEATMNHHPEGGPSSIAEIIHLPRLERVELSDLPKLRSVFSRSGFIGCDSLKDIEVCSCPRLNFLFSCGACLQNLEEIKVKYYDETETITEEEEAATMNHRPEGGPSSVAEIVDLPRLERVKLIGLPELRNVFNRGFIGFSSLEGIRVVGCPRLKYLFSFGARLQNLEAIRVEDCGEMESIIEEKEATMNHHPEGRPSSIAEIIHLPSLEMIELIGIPKLRNGHSRGFVGCNSLKKINVVRCPRLKYLFSRGARLQNLEDIRVSNCGEMESIIEEEEGAMMTHHPEGGPSSVAEIIHLPRLWWIRLSGLPKLRSVYRGRGFVDCNSLKEIRVSDCPVLRRFPIRCLELPPALKRHLWRRELVGITGMGK